MGLWRRWDWRWAAVGAAMAIAACAPTREIGPEGADPFPRKRALETFVAGYTTIADKYIQPIEVAAVATDGLRGLQSIDPAVALARDGEAIVLTAAKSEPVRLGAPRDGDVAGWATLTVEATTAGRRLSPELRAAAPEKIYEAVFDRALAGLDAYSRYAGAEEAERNRSRRDGFGGVGVRFQMKNGAALVQGVVEGTPAARAGIKAGDRITHVDGVSVQGLDTEEVGERLRGALKSRVALTVERSGVPEAMRFELEREHVIPETVAAEIADGVLSLEITGFNQNTAASAAATIRKALDDPRSPIRGIVLDLRGNPGGLLRQAVRLADLFLAEGTISATRGRHPDSIHQYDATGTDIARGLPLIVLIDGKSASAAEIVAAALQDRGRAIVVGTASYGKGTVQTVVRLPNDGEMTLTWSQFVAPSGYLIHGLGVMPTVCTSGTAASAHDLVTLAVDGSKKAAEALAAWRRAGGTNDDQRNALRDACPPQRRLGATETALARRLVSDRPLYAQLVDVSTPTVTASTEGARP